MNLMELSPARTLVRHAGFESRLSHDESRLEVWRAGLIQGVCIGSTMIHREGGHAFVSRPVLARILGGA